MVAGSAGEIALVGCFGGEVVCDAEGDGDEAGQLRLVIMIIIMIIVMIMSCSERIRS